MIQQDLANLVDAEQMENGSTPLHCMAMWSAGLEIIQILLESGAQVNCHFPRSGVLKKSVPGITGLIRGATGAENRDNEVGRCDGR